MAVNIIDLWRLWVQDVGTQNCTGFAISSSTFCNNELTVTFCALCGLFETPFRDSNIEEKKRWATEDFHPQQQHQFLEGW
jgi:hypothetical protein